MRRVVCLYLSKKLDFTGPKRRFVGVFGTLAAVDGCRFVTSLSQPAIPSLLASAVCTGSLDASGARPVAGA